jgi:hypothetical protein
LPRFFADCVVDAAQPLGGSLRPDGLVVVVVTMFRLAGKVVVAVASMGG